MIKGIMEWKQRQYIKAEIAVFCDYKNCFWDLCCFVCSEGGFYS